MSYFTPFTGRDAEIEQLKGLLDNALDYHGSMAVVKGPTGVGKSRLMSHFLDSINTDSYHILHGRSLRDSKRPLASISGMVEDFLCQGDHSPKWMVRFFPPEIAVHLLPVMPRLRDLYPLEMEEGVIENSVRSAAYVFGDFIRKLSWSRPVVILLDDIQWMGEDSLTLLKNMAYSISDSSILLVASIRTGSEKRSAQDVIDELLNEHHVEIIKLSNLSRDEVSGLVAARFKAPAPEEFCKWLVSISKGNPLFIEEIIKTLLRQNIIHTVKGSDAWEVKGDYRDFRISESLESVVKYRLGHMDDEETRTLECSAVIGENFELEILQDLLRKTSPEAELRSVNILSSLGMLERSKGSYRFSHPLLRLVLYEGMDIDRRRMLHRNLAGILEKRDGCDAEIAIHLTKDLLPEENTKELALRLFRIASNLRMEALDLPTSHLLMDQALRIAEISGLEEEHILRIRAELNYLTWMLGGEALSYEKATSLLEGLLIHDLNREAALMCRLLFHTSLVKMDLEHASEYISQGIGLLANKDSFYWGFRAEEPLLKRRMGLLEESLKESEKLIEKIPVEEAPEALYRLQTNLSMVHFLLGNVSDAELHAKRARETVIRYHLKLRSAESRMNYGLVLMSEGKLDSALNEFRESLKEAMLLNRTPVVGINMLYVGSCFYSKGEYKEAMTHLDEAERKAEEINNPRLRLFTLRYKANVHLKSGEPQVALDIIKEIEQSPLAEQLVIDLQSMKALAFFKLQDSENAMLCIEKAIELATESMYSTKLGYALGIRGLVQLELGNPDKAMDDLSESKSLLLAKGAIPMMSDVLVEFGLKLDNEKGSSILAEGLELKRFMNATAVIEEVRDTLQTKNSHYEKILQKLDSSLAETQIRTIEIGTFGGLSLQSLRKQDEGMQRGWAYSKSRELLAILLLKTGSGGVTRAHLASLLWADKPEKKAQASLRMSLSHIRKVLGSAAILQDGDYLSLNQDIIRTDVWEFNELLNEWDSSIRKGKDHAAEDRAVKAIDLYRGVFLPEFYSLPLEDEQFRLQSRMKELLLWMALRCMDRVEYRTALIYARKLLTMDPCSEQACRIVMESLVANDDWTTAIRQFNRLKRSLNIEFGAEPDKKTIALYESILNQHKDTPNSL